MAITPQKHSKHVKDPNHACLQSTSINIARPHKNGSIKMKLIEGVGNLWNYPINTGGSSRWENKNQTQCRKKTKDMILIKNKE
jgi:hypothetical protein